MSEHTGKVQMDLEKLRDLLQAGVRNRGEDYTAQWLVEEVQKQPAAFLHLLLSEPPEPDS